MSKVNKTIKYSLGFGTILLAVLALGVLVMPLKADAAPTFVPGHYNSDGSYTYGDFYWPESTNVNNNNYINTNTNSYQNNNYSNPAKPSTNNQDNTNTDNSEKNVSSLASNAIFGSNSFGPSGIIQWILFAIIILLLIIIVRKFFGGSEKYYQKPMKYS